MRLIRIDFRGFKRLADTGCNIDGRLVAFVGPNEAGKSTVLDGLVWLSDGGPLPSASVSRGRDVAADEEMVTARFILDQADLDALGDLDVVQPPRHFILVRDREGGRRTGVTPTLHRNPEKFKAAQAAIDDFLATLPPEAANEADNHLENAHVVTVEILPNPDIAWSEEQSLAMDRVQTWLIELSGDPSVAQDIREAAESARDALHEVRSRLEGHHPQDEARQRLLARAPNFLLFDEDDRILERQYNLRDDALRAGPPQALANLLAVAEVDLELLWQMQKADDVGRLKTYLKQANRRLLRRVHPAWRQAMLTVELDVSGGNLQVILNELSDDGARTSITERSDGLKTFLALVFFIASKQLDTPPVLLIDEAEMHLHLDAQADLVNVLLSEVDVSKVIYTTHSPGCLPPDLGTGVRFVAPEPDRTEVSRLRSDFWNTGEAGFSSLLFAMGAGAAAFSACRRAVLAEGPSDMILLPSMFRSALGAESLLFQVAPGLTAPPGSDSGVDEVAARVVYLTDGDRGGVAHKRRLLASGIPSERILSLPSGKATEDLIDPDVYVGAVNGVLKDAGVAITLTKSELNGGTTIARAVQDWCIEHGISPPGKVAVASRLIQNPESLQLTTAGRDALRALYGVMGTVLGHA